MIDGPIILFMVLLSVTALWMVGMVLTILSMIWFVTAPFLFGLWLLNPLDKIFFFWVLCIILMINVDFVWPLFGIDGLSKTSEHE